MKFKTTRWPLLNAGMIAAAFLSMCLLIYSPGPERYAHLYLLPLTFLITAFFMVNLYRDIFSEMSLLIIVCGYFIRMVVTPCLFCLGAYHSFFRVYPAQEIMLRSILWICYEHIVVMVVCRFRHRPCGPARPLDLRSYDNTKVLGASCLLLLFLLAAYAATPALEYVQPLFFQSSLTDSTNLFWDNESIVPRGGLARIIYSLFSFIWPIVRCILPVAALCFLLDRGRGRGGMYLSMLVLLTPFLFLGADSMGPIFADLLAIIFIVRVYGRRAKPVVTAGALVAGLAVVAIVATKIEGWKAWRGGSGISVIAQILNAYFPGFENTAIMLCVDDPSRLESLFFDFYNAIPFKETIFGFHGTYLVDLFAQAAGVEGQIVPFTANIGHYTGIVLSPFVTAFIADRAMQMERRFKETENYWGAFLCLAVSITSAMAIHMYSFSIYFRSLVNLCLPLMCLTALSRGRRYRIRWRISK